MRSKQEKLDWLQYSAIRSQHRSTYSNGLASDVLPTAPAFVSKRFSPGNPMEGAANGLATRVTGFSLENAPIDRLRISERLYDVLHVACTEALAVMNAIGRRGNRSRGGMEGAGSSHRVGQLGLNMAPPTGQRRARGGKFGPKWCAPSRPVNGYLGSCRGSPCRPLMNASNVFLM
jgi:hypothetical protein